MFKNLLKKRVRVNWVLFAIAALFAAFRHDCIAAWIVAIAILVALFEGV
jgi:hypothetical protein